MWRESPLAIRSDRVVMLTDMVIKFVPIDHETLVMLASGSGLTESSIHGIEEGKVTNDLLASLLCSVMVLFENKS